MPIAETRCTIDREARDRLADLLDRLIRREIRPADFYRDVRRTFVKCPDRGVTNIVAAAVTNVTEPNLWVDWWVKEDRAELLRCEHFLRSDREYDWPEVIFTKSKGGALGLLAGGGVLVLSLIILVLIEAGFLLSFFLPQIFFVLAAIWVSSYFNTQRENTQLADHRKAGREFEAWPFVRCVDIGPDVDELVPLRRRKRYAKSVG